MTTEIAPVGGISESTPLRTISVSPPPKRPMQLGQILAGLIYALIALFFLTEMLLKPISGEDAHMQRCMLDGWGSFGECARAAIQFIPRLGEIYQRQTIWLYTNLPSLGVGMFLRLFNALIALAVVWVVFRLAVGRSPRLNIRDALVCLAAFWFMVMTPMNQVIFNGFSQVNNYLPLTLAYVFTIYAIAEFDRLVARFGRIPALLLLAFSVFCASAGVETGVPVMLFVIIAAWLVTARLNRNRIALSTSLGTEINSPQAVTSTSPLALTAASAPGRSLLSGGKWFAALLGWLLGGVYFFVIGDGLGIILRRTDTGYRGAADLRGGSLASLVLELAFNAARNLVFFLPFIFLAVVAVALLWHPKGNSEPWSKPTGVLFSLIAAILYILSLSPLPDILDRVGAPALGLLLVPVCALLHQALHRIPKHSSGILVLGVLSTLLAAAMFIDNIVTLNQRLAVTRTAFSQITEIQCVDRQIVNNFSAEIWPTSPLFGFDRYEHSFSFIFSSWYGDNLHVNLLPIPIMDECPPYN